MIVAVTINTALDYGLFVPRFGLELTVRATSTTVTMAGKPSDAAWVLGELGVPCLLLGCSAGATGERMETMLRARGVTTDFVQVDGETRFNVVVVSEQPAGQMTITADTLKVTADHLGALRRKLISALETATCLIIGGSLPSCVDPAVYGEYVGLARARGVPVILDATGSALRSGLAAGPTFIKPNRDELETTLGRSLPTLPDIYYAARDLLAQYGASPIVSLGGQGALAVLPDRAYYIPVLPVQVVSTAGAGDSILAGVAAVISRGGPVEEALSLGFACAAAVVSMPGTADCRREDVERFLPQVRLEPYTPPS